MYCGGVNGEGGKHGANLLMDIAVYGGVNAAIVGIVVYQLMVKNAVEG